MSFVAAFILNINFQNNSYALFDIVLYETIGRIGTLDFCIFGWIQNLDTDKPVGFRS